MQDISYFCNATRLAYNFTPAWTATRRVAQADGWCSQCYPGICRQPGRPLAVAPLKHGKSFQLPGGSCCSCCCCCRCRVNCCPFEPGQNVQYFWHFSLVVVRATMILNHGDAVEGEGESRYWWGGGEYCNLKSIFQTWLLYKLCQAQGRGRSSWLCSLPQIFVLIFPINPHSYIYIYMYIYMLPTSYLTANINWFSFNNYIYQCQSNVEGFCNFMNCQRVCLSEINVSFSREI